MLSLNSSEKNSKKKKKSCQFNLKRKRNKYRLLAANKLLKSMYYFIKENKFIIEIEKLNSDFQRNLTDMKDRNSVLEINKFKIIQELESH